MVITYNSQSQEVIWPIFNITIPPQTSSDLSGADTGFPFKGMDFFEEEWVISLAKADLTLKPCRPKPYSVNRIVAPTVKNC